MTAVRPAVAKEIKALPEALRGSGLAATALTLASRLDEAALRDTAPIARELRNTLAELRNLAADMPTGRVDPLDDLASRRAARVSGA